jgi:hypothetical protein
MNRSSKMARAPCLLVDGQVAVAEERADAIPFTRGIVRALFKGLAARDSRA